MGNLGELQWHFLAFLFLALLTRSASGVCYNIYGDVEKSLEYQPCGSGDVTMCCGTNRTADTSTNTQDICLKNGMCLNSMNYGHSYWRISCTSKNWNSGSCLSYCMDQKVRPGPILEKAQLDAVACFLLANSLRRNSKMTTLAMRK